VEIKPKSFIFFPSRSSPLFNERRLKKPLSKITTKKALVDKSRGAFLFMHLQAVAFVNP